MCGIVGSVILGGDGRVEEDVLARMTAAIRHRGPDAGGVWSDGCAGLGARRLAVIDLSPRAHQPMANDAGTIHIAFNGEVYNFQELRRDLESRGHRFRSGSDTEVVLRLYEEQGIEAASRLRGMFAFAIWDASRRTLLLARDRLGKKPLFYYTDGRRIVFASEPKALLQDDSIPARASPAAIRHYLTFGVVPGSMSAFEGFRKVPPAHVLIAQNGCVTLHRYWTLHYLPKRGESESVLAEELSSRLEEAVGLRMISDVPLGALLSGGIDSSVVVAMMRRRTSGIIRTFSIGFDDRDYDELPRARAVARRFETEHHEAILRPNAAELLPRVVWHHDEPFGDSSALPSFVVSELARRSVTVALTGDGGDESFLGYERYRATVLAGRADRLPHVLRSWMAAVARLLPGVEPRARLSRIIRFAEALTLEPRERYLYWLTHGGDDGGLYTDDFARTVADVTPQRLIDEAYEASDAPTFIERTAHADIQHYLPDDLLVKMDIASMAHSLEVRSPLLDHTLVEFTAGLPARLKLRSGASKYLVRRIMKGVLPGEVLAAPKRGFGVPIDRWFRRDLREMTYDVLLDARARERGIVRPHAVRRLLDEHASGRRDHHGRLWSLLMLELWYRMYIDRRCPASAPASF